MLRFSNENYSVPNLGDIDIFRFYNLTAYGWRFEDSYSALIQNDPIKVNIVKDFSSLIAIDSHKVSAMFELDWVFKRWGVGMLLLLYTSKNREGILYYLTDPESDICGALSGKQRVFNNQLFYSM